MNGSHGAEKARWVKNGGSAQAQTIVVYEDGCQVQIIESVVDRGKDGHSCRRFSEETPMLLAQSGYAPDISDLL